MFDGSGYPMSLDESLFEAWLEKGRESKIGYTHMLIIWDAINEEYLPVYLEDRNKINSYEVHPYAAGSEALIAVYDLYSEARIVLPN